MHCIFQNYDSLIYLLNELDNLNISTSFFVDDVGNHDFRYESEKKIIKNFIVDKSSRKHYYLTMLEKLEQPCINQHNHT